MARTPTATPTPTPALAPVLRPLWLTEALVSAEVGDAVLLEVNIDEDGPDGVWVAVGLVMRYVLDDFGVDDYRNISESARSRV